MVSLLWNRVILRRRMVLKWRRRTARPPPSPPLAPAIDVRQMRVRRVFFRFNPSFHKLYTLSCNGRIISTVVTHRDRVLRGWIRNVRLVHHKLIKKRKMIVALGIKGGLEEYSGASTLQLCVGSKCILFQLEWADEVPPALEKFLSDDRITFVSFDSKTVFEKLLLDSEYRIYVPNVKDWAVEQDKAEEDASVRTLTESILHAKVLKDVAVEEGWGSVLLSNEHVEDACGEVYACYRIAVELTKTEIELVTE